jgi:hypothetical protein
MFRGHAILSEKRVELNEHIIEILERNSESDPRVIAVIRQNSELHGITAELIFEQLGRGEE